MRTIITFILLIFSASLFAQTGTGWDQVRRKQNFKDEVNFVKTAHFRSTVTIDEAIEGSVLYLPKYITINAQVNSYELVLTDDSKLITMSNGAANNLTVPPENEVAFPIGTQITVCSIGTGQTTIVAHAGVTVSSAGGALKLRVQYSTCTLIKIGSNLWLCVGDISV